MRSSPKDSPCSAPTSCRPHLDLQLLHHLHLNPALGRAPVVQGVLGVEVSWGRGKARTKTVSVSQGCSRCHHQPPIPAPQPGCGLTGIEKDKDEGEVGENGARQEAFSRPPSLMSLLRSPLQRDLIANELIK